jgi:uncharacterized protein YjbJ (UPF0337 family)
MQNDIIQGHWKEVKGKLKQQWGKVTDDDLTRLKGTYEELEGLLQQRYGYAKAQADKAIDDFINRNQWH